LEPLRKDQATLQEARGGDPAAVGQLLWSFEAYLRVLARQTLHTAARAHASFDESDLIQTGLTAAYYSFPKFRGTTVGEFTAWLRKVALRTMHRYMNEQLRKGARGDLPESELEGSSASWPPNKAIFNEERERVMDALAQLPPHMQDVLMLHIVDNLPHKQIAELMGRTEGAVRVLFVRSLGRFDQVLNPVQTA
jgi:RNA polymerase sigma-70 factor (ECF subfamily)